MEYTRSTDRLIAELNRLPGVGRKMAQRIALHLLKLPREDAVRLARMILEVKKKTGNCTQCFNLTETDPCPTCSDQERDRGILCVVEEPHDLAALEKSGVYRGLYHVLGGSLSPLEGIGPDELRVKELLARLEAGEVSEKDAYAAIVQIDAKALSFAASLLANGRGTPELVLHARVRLHQSKKRAGQADERFHELRAELLQMISQDHDARVAARVGSPEGLNRRLLATCREFPLDAEVRDEYFERAAAAHRDDLWAELRQLQRVEARPGGGPPIERKVAIELELWDLRLLLEEVDFHTAHTAKARIFEHVLEELSSRKVGVLPTKAELAEAELELHREKFLLGEEDEDYVRRRAEVFLAERRRLAALVSSGRLTAGEMALRIGAWQERFPGTDTLRAWMADE